METARRMESWQAGPNPIIPAGEGAAAARRALEKHHEAAGAHPVEDFDALLNKQFQPAEKAPQHPMEPKPPQSAVEPEELDTVPVKMAQDHPESSVERATEEEKKQIGSRRGGRAGSVPPMPIVPPNPPWRGPYDWTAFDPNRPRYKPPEPAEEDVPVDAELLAELKKHGHRNPVANLKDPRMRDETPFQPIDGWRIEGNVATWASPEDPHRTRQVCVNAPSRRIIETTARGRSQRIEEGPTGVTVQRFSV